MLIKVTDCYTAKGKEYFRFDLYDGPDGIEHVSGFALDLVETFSKILEWRERIARDYVHDLDETGDETDN